MKPASPALQSLLAARQFYAADLYTFTLVGGSVLRYTSGDRDIVWSGNTFASGGPRFQREGTRAKAHWKVGVTVDTLSFDAMPHPGDLVGGQPFLAAVTGGVFDGAELLLERAFMPSYGNVSAGTVILFVGRVAEVAAGRTAATFDVSSHLELLNLDLPRNLWMPGCVNTLGDASCTVDLASYAVNGAFQAGSSVNFLYINPLPQGPGYFSLGKMQITSGANAGLWRSVVGYSAGAISVTPPFPKPPAGGDTFTVYPGCDKTFTGPNGCPKFANQANFRGTPFVPTPETSV